MIPFSVSIRGDRRRLFTPYILLITFVVTSFSAAAIAVESPTSLSRQTTLYYTLQQRIAHPGDISTDGLAGVKLLLAQLYSEMGMLQAAENTLDALDGRASIVQLRDMGRLLLARKYRLRGEPDKADAQLLGIAGTLDAELDNERQQMLALSASERGDVTQALLLFGKVQRGVGPVLLARFNYAVMLLRGGETEYGLALLQLIAELDEEGEPVAALRDRANLLLGYHYLQQQSHEEARQFLQRVRQGKLYSRAALLALGWAELELRGAEYAMVPWMELLSHDRGDSLEDEAQLAIAAAIASKGASRRVVDNYQRLIVQFEQGRKAIPLERQSHAEPYAADQIAAVLESEGDSSARNSVAAITLSRLLQLRQRLTTQTQLPKKVKDSQYFKQLWSQLHALYPEPDGISGIGVAAYMARSIESFILRSLQTRSIHPSSDLDARISADYATLDGEIGVVAEWYRRERLVALSERDERLQAYIERARLAIARSYDEAIRRQERE